MKKTEEQIKADLAKTKQIEELEWKVAKLKWELATAKWKLLPKCERDAVEYTHWLLKWRKAVWAFRDKLHVDYIEFKEDNILDTDDLPF